VVGIPFPTGKNMSNPYFFPQETIFTIRSNLSFQVSQFGCSAFALLFDDIESEMCEADKEMFQSFAHAQVSVTNEIYQHLGQTKFLFCPTGKYCGFTYCDS
jgi:hypothetical protein